jgi:methionyl-tRNA synthetase
MNDKNIITFEDYDKVNIIVGEIIDAVEVEKTAKLVKLTVNFGPDRHKTIVSGIRHQYSVDQLKGLKTAFIVNFEPREVRGILSEGMLFAAEDSVTGKIIILPIDATPGSKVG